MSSNCQQVKSDYERLQTLTDRFLLEYEKVKDAGDRGVLKRLKRELETAYQELEVKLIVSINEARETLGAEMVLGPEEIFNAFGFEVKESEIPPIPYSREELEKAKELGEQLILRVSHDGQGNPMTMERINEIMETRMDRKTEGNLFESIVFYKEEDFYRNDPLKTEWKLVGSTFVPDVSSPLDKEGKYTKDTRFNDSVHQTRLLREYLKSIGAGTLTEEEEEECSDERLQSIYKQGGFDWDTQGIADREQYFKNDEKFFFGQILEMQINLKHRRSATEIIYDWILRFKKTKDRGILENAFDWSRSFSTRFPIVMVGNINSDGAIFQFWYTISDEGNNIGLISQR